MRLLTDLIRLQIAGVRLIEAGSDRLTSHSAGAFLQKTIQARVGAASP
jgi:hypothetical protein